jgi:hypothetical protein
LAEIIEDSENSEGIGAGESWEGCLIDDKGTGDKMGALEVGKVSWGRGRVGSTKVAKESGSECVKNKSAFTRAAYSCDAGEESKGDGSVDILKVMG